MKKVHKIGSYEAISLTTTAIVNKIFFTSTSLTVQLAGTAAWYMTIISFLCSTLFFLLTYLLIKRFPGKNFQDITQTVLGKIPGRAINLALSFFWIFYTASALREFIEMIKIYNLPNTPISFILITFILTIIIIVYKGQNSLYRTASICFPVILAGLATLLLLAIPIYEPALLTPILGYGIDRTLLVGVLRSSAYQEILLLSYIAGYLRDPAQYKRNGLISLSITCSVASISILAYIMTFGYSSGRDHLSGLFALSRSVYYNRFIQRLESIFLFIWVLSSLIAVAATFFFSIKLYSSSFNIKNIRPLIIPFGLIIYAVCIMPKNMAELVTINLSILRQYGFMLMYTIPLLILLIAVITGKKGDRKNAKKS